MFCLHKWNVVKSEICLWKLCSYTILPATLFTIFADMNRWLPNTVLALSVTAIIMVAIVVFSIGTIYKLATPGSLISDVNTIAKFMPGSHRDMICLKCGKVYLDATIYKERRLHLQKIRKQNERDAMFILDQCREMREGAKDI